MKNLKPWVFWPTLVLVLGALLEATLDGDRFLATLNLANAWVLSTFSGGFAVGALFFLCTCAIVFVSPLGRVRLGGPKAQPLLSPLSWCTISLCTTTAVGILFWSMAEPIYHLSAPPISLGIAPRSPGAAQFSMAALYLHWTFVPCAIYALPALMFALAFHNLGLPFSLSSPLVPLIGRRLAARLSPFIDSLSLYTLVAGMAASLATGVLTLAGGLEHLYGIPSAKLAWVLIGISIVAAFLLSALSGLHRGVKWLSNINAAFFVFLAVFFIIYGPSAATWQLSLSAGKEFGREFFANSLFTKFASTDPWPKAWTVFYWAVWLAWAPVTAAFLGRIGVGYTVRSFLAVNLLLPAVFSWVWMSIFGGAALSLQSSGELDLISTLQTHGPEVLVYRVLDTFPLARFLIPAFLITAFISYVTAADSNTMAMAGMSSHGISSESADPPIWVKLIWGGLVGALSLTMLCLSGIEGIKTLSYLGGVPALFYEFAIAASLLLLVVRRKRFGLAV